MRSDITVSGGHRKCSPGATWLLFRDLEPAGSPAAALGAAQPPSWCRGRGSRGLSHTAHRVSPRLRGVGPSGSARSFSAKHRARPAVLFPPSTWPVSRTAAESGAEDHLFPSVPAVLLPPAHPCRPQPPAAHTSKHVSVCSGAAGTLRGTFSHSLWRGFVRCPLFSYKNTFPLCSCMGPALHTPTPHSPY